MSGNPYCTYAPVTIANGFVGRQKILQDIEKIIKKSNTLLLYGQRRIGKTSLLMMELIRLSSEYHPIFVDWQDKAQQNLKGILKELTSIISEQLHQEKPVLESDIPSAFKKWLFELSNAQNKPLVFMFDEFDVIAASGSVNEATSEIVGYFKELMCDFQHIKWLFVIGCQVEKLTQLAMDSLFRNMESQMVSYLTREDTQELICLSEKNQTLQWFDSTKDRIWFLTSGHPYFTRKLCDEIWEDAHTNNHPQQTPKVTLQHIDRATNETLVTTQSILESLWRSLSPAERVVASALAQRKTWSEFLKPLREITLKLKEARDSLIKWELIKKEQRGDYHFWVEIIRRWVEKHKSYFYDELDKIEPFAEEIYETARRLEADRRLENAKVLLEQAIQINPYHTQAHQLLAKILIEQKQFEKAHQILRSLYDYNREVEKDEEVLLKGAKQAEAKKWQQRVYKWIKDHSKRLGQSGAVIGAFLLSYWFSSQVFPQKIILEVEHDQHSYSLTGVPTSKAYQLQFIQISSDLPPQRTPSFTYTIYKVPLLTKEGTNDYFLDQETLQKELPHLQQFAEFDYPHKDNPFEFKFSFEFSEPSHTPIKFSCDVTTIDKHAVVCEVKQKGYLSIYRGIPWWASGALLGAFLILLIEIITAIKNKEEHDVY